MGSRRSHDRDSTQHAIGDMVEQLVLPKMVQSHRELGLRPKLICDLDGFIELLLSNNQPSLIASIETMLEAGHPLELIYSEVLTAAARRLGEKWLRDELNFSEVTIATWQIEQVLHHFHQAFENSRRRHMSKASILISMMPGDQHSLGAKMLSAFFRKEHWEATLLQPQSLQAIHDEIIASKPSLIAITVSQLESLEQVKLLLKLIRQQPALRSMPWMIGGRVINEHPMQAVAVLSDRNIHLCQGDANQALVLARRLLGLEARGQAQSEQSKTATQH
ncbi:MAG: B12-binding domain-containing protein [Betaproteobacteria bacterium]